jgi:hypothetical protein
MGREKTRKMEEKREKKGHGWDKKGRKEFWGGKNVVIVLT